MVGLGTIINAAAIVAGGLCGLLFGRKIKEQAQDTLMLSCGVCVLFLGIAGTMEKMLQVEGGALTSGRALFIVVCLALGGVVGEIIDLENGFERFGNWLKIKTGSAKDTQFVNGFVTASLTVCIGAMAIVGAIEDGVSGDYSVLATKGVLDFVIVMVMTCTMGKGCIFSAIPVAIWEGLITVLAGFLRPLLTEAILANISLIGSILIFCVGINLVWGKKIRVANLLPSLIFAVVFALLPVSF